MISTPGCSFSQDAKESADRSGASPPAGDAPGHRGWCRNVDPSSRPNHRPPARAPRRVARGARRPRRSRVSGLVLIPQRRCQSGARLAPEGLADELDAPAGVAWSSAPRRRRIRGVARRRSAGGTRWRGRRSGGPSARCRRLGPARASRPACGCSDYARAESTPQSGHGVVVPIVSTSRVIVSPAIKTPWSARGADSGRRAGSDKQGLRSELRSESGHRSTSHCTPLPHGKCGRMLCRKPANLPPSRHV